jgi:glutamate synthase domain-containing protein 2
MLYDEAAEGVKFADLPEDWVCPICGAPKSLFEPAEEAVPEKKAAAMPTMIPIESDLDLIQQMATTGQTVITPGGTRKNLPSWDDVLLVGAGLARKPLDQNVEVSTRTIIGRHSHQPMEIETPIMIAHMSFGALSHENKVAVAKASALCGTSVGSGEGGILNAEFDRAHKYVFEYAPNGYSATDENLQKVDAIEIKIGQGAKPGMGGHLPGDKVTAEVATVRGVKRGTEVISPASFPQINEPWDLLLLVNNLRERSGGRPIGIKLAAGHIEEDLKWVQQAKPDFITIDGRGGSTGAAPVVAKDAMGTPTLYALYRARKFIDENHLKIGIIISGGLRTSADFVKALALGADAVAIATSVLTALAAPGSLASQKKVANFINASTEELKMFARAVGRHDIHQLHASDLATTSTEVSKHTNIRHV